MKYHDACEILGLDPTIVILPDETQNKEKEDEEEKETKDPLPTSSLVLKKAFKKRALKCHPDKNLEDPTEAKEAFQQATKAYTFLLACVSRGETGPYHPKHATADTYQDYHDNDNDNDNDKIDEQNNNDGEQQEVYHDDCYYELGDRSHCVRAGRPADQNLQEKLFQMFFAAMKGTGDTDSCRGTGLSVRQNNNIGSEFMDDFFAEMNQEQEHSQQKQRRMDRQKLKQQKQKQDIAWMVERTRQAQQEGRDCFEAWNIKQLTGECQRRGISFKGKQQKDIVQELINDEAEKRSRRDQKMKSDAAPLLNEWLEVIELPRWDELTGIKVRAVDYFDGNYTVEWYVNSDKEKTETEKIWCTRETKQAFIKPENLRLWTSDGLVTSSSPCDDTPTPAPIKEMKSKEISNSLSKSKFPVVDVSFTKRDNHSVAEKLPTGDAVFGSKKPEDSIEGTPVTSKIQKKSVVVKTPSKKVMSSLEKTSVAFGLPVDTNESSIDKEDLLKLISAFECMATKNANELQHALKQLPTSSSNSSGFQTNETNDNPFLALQLIMIRARRTSYHLKEVTHMAGNAKTVKAVQSPLENLRYALSLADPYKMDIEKEFSPSGNSFKNKLFDVLKTEDGHSWIATVTKETLVGDMKGDANRLYQLLLEGRQWHQLQLVDAGILSAASTRTDLFSPKQIQAIGMRLDMARKVAGEEARKCFSDTQAQEVLESTRLSARALEVREITRGATIRLRRTDNLALDGKLATFMGFSRFNRYSVRLLEGKEIELKESQFQKWDGSGEASFAQKAVFHATRWVCSFCDHSHQGPGVDNLLICSLCGEATAQLNSSTQYAAASGESPIATEAKIASEIIAKPKSTSLGRASASDRMQRDTASFDVTSSDVISNKGSVEPNNGRSSIINKSNDSSINKVVPNTSHRTPSNSERDTILEQNSTNFCSSTLSFDVVRCYFGRKCNYLKQGRCRYFHPVKDLEWVSTSNSKAESSFVPSQVGSSEGKKDAMSRKSSNSKQVQKRPPKKFYRGATSPNNVTDVERMSFPHSYASMNKHQAKDLLVFLECHEGDLECPPSAFVSLLQSHGICTIADLDEALNKYYSLTAVLRRGIKGSKELDVFRKNAAAAAAAAVSAENEDY